MSAVAALRLHRPPFADVSLGWLIAGARRDVVRRDAPSRAQSREPAVDHAPDPAADEIADRGDVAAALSGDGGAFARLVERHQQVIARHLHRFTRDRREHEELVQDVFVEAWRSLPGWRGRAPLRHWLRAIATRVGYRFWTERSRRRDAAAGLEAEDLASLAAAADERSPIEAAELAHALLARLAPRDRLLLTLIYLEGCSVKQAAELTGWSSTMVKVQAHRARRRLAALVDRLDLP